MAINKLKLIHFPSCCYPIPTVQVSDTTSDDSNNAACNKKLQLLITNELLSSTKCYLGFMDYMNHLMKDKKLASILKEVLPALQQRENIALRLMASIMSQQLNTKVAKVIYHRFLELYNGEEPTPKKVLKTPTEKLRVIGLSNAKVSYVHNVARFCMENNIDDKKLLNMKNDEIINLLTEIKGVGDGRWKCC